MHVNVWHFLDEAAASSPGALALREGERSLDYGAARRLALRLAARRTAPVANVPILDLVDAIADVEYSITARDAAKRIAGCWIVVHIAASIALYGLLLTHIGSGIYYGLRWLP